MKYIFYKSFLFLLLVGIFITVPSLALAKKSSSLVQAYVPGEVIVKFKKVKINLKTSSGQASVRGFASRKGSERKADLKDQNLSVFKITDGRSVEAVIDDLKNDPDVEYAEPNYKRRLFTINTNDTYKNDLWGLDNTGQTVNGVVGTADADIDAPEAWVKSTGASTTIIAVIDTGVAYNHLDIADSMCNGINCVDENNVFLGNCNHGYDYIDNDKTPLPTISSHGTHVAGTIAAVKNNSKGIIGIAPSAKIMALRVDYVDPDGSEYIDSASVVKAISFAKNNGARIINASFGGTGFSQAEYDAIAAFGAAGGMVLQIQKII
ncbi:MAG: S8 family serine peptidase [Candidatus Falkowbacteria bacterium]|nr:S8 family serine peptidase [Candidatus Falkowbacteria bacterium]